MTSRNHDTIKKAVDLRKKLYSRSLLDKINKEATQLDLTEVYKPLLKGQKQQTREITKTQKETSEAQLQQHQAIQDIKLQEHDELVAEIRKQPLIIPLIKSLNRHPRVVDVISGKSDGSELTDPEKDILKQLENVNDDVLRVLIDYYRIPRNRGDSLISELEKLPTGDAPSSSGRPLLGISEEARKKLTESQLEVTDEFTKRKQKGEEIYLDLMNVKKYSKEKSHRDDSIGYKFSMEENRNDFLAYLESVNYVHDLSKFPFTVIREVNPKFYNEIETRKKEVRGKGLTTTFLSSDPKELLKKLNILVAEKEAGNTNIVTEASAITDELRRLGVLTFSQVKKIYKLIA